MSLHDDLNVAITREIESLGDAIAMSPTTVARAVQARYNTGHIAPQLEYASLEHIKQMARAVLGKRFESDGEESESYQGELFSGSLQEYYPIPRKKDQEPVYKKRDALSHAELLWNVRQLRKSAAARLEHADALQAWADSRESMQCAA